MAGINLCAIKKKISLKSLDLYRTCMTEKSVKYVRLMDQGSLEGNKEIAGEG